MTAIITIWSIFPVSSICKLLWGSARKKRLVQSIPAKRNIRGLSTIYSFCILLSTFFNPFWTPAFSWLTDDRISSPSDRCPTAFLTRQGAGKPPLLFLKKTAGFWALSIAAGTMKRAYEIIMGYSCRKLHHAWKKKTSQLSKTENLNWSIVVLEELLQRLV